MCQFQPANLKNISCQNWKLLIILKKNVECFLWAHKKATSVNVDLVIFNFVLSFYVYIFFLKKFILNRKFTKWFSAAWGGRIPYDGFCRIKTIL